MNLARVLAATFSCQRLEYGRIKHLTFTGEAFRFVNNVPLIVMANRRRCFTLDYTDST